MQMRGATFERRAVIDGVRRCVIAIDHNGWRQFERLILSRSLHLNAVDGIEKPSTTFEGI